MGIDIKKECSIFIGNIGCGKTYTIAYLVNKYQDKYECFHNVANLKIGHYLSISDYKKYKLPRGSLYFIDEAGIEFNNRAYKDLDRTYIRILKYTRHDGVNLFIFSQALDVDITIRRICKYTYLMNKFLWFTTITKWSKKIIPPTEKNKQDDFQDKYGKVSLIPIILFRNKKIFALYDSYAPIPDDIRENYPFEKRK